MEFRKRVMIALHFKCIPTVPVEEQFAYNLTPETYNYSIAVDG